MSNNWDIPNWLEEKVRKRDMHCVYCSIPLKSYSHTKGTPHDKATWEHINNDGLPTEDNITLCCASCNSSKGIKKLLNWFDTQYCKDKNINQKTVANIVKRYIKNL